MWALVPSSLPRMCCSVLQRRASDRLSHNSSASSLFPVIQDPDWSHLSFACISSCLLKFQYSRKLAFIRCVRVFCCFCDGLYCIAATALRRQSQRDLLCVTARKGSEYRGHNLSVWRESKMVIMASFHFSSKCLNAMAIPAITLKLFLWAFLIAYLPSR